MKTVRTKTIGQIAHEAGERAGSWARKWEHMHHSQRLEWEAVATAVAVVVAAEERERFRGYFREALADTGIVWPGEVDILYDKCFAAPYASDEDA